MLVSGRVRKHGELARLEEGSGPAKGWVPLDGKESLSLFVGCYEKNYPP